MLNKKEIKDIQSLRYKKQRDESGYFFAEGPKVVKELLQVLPKHLVKIYATSTWLNDCPNGIQNSVVQITEIELEKITSLQTPNEVLAIFKQLVPQVPHLSPNELCLYLDTIQDPGNFGTIIRIADWFKIKCIVCAPGCADIYNAKVIQATMGSIGRVSFFYDEEGKWLQQQKGNIYAATLSGKSIYDIEKNSGGILIIGNESKGVS
ncbi:MAG TPA: TrmH family RNA methyltransferase, partial [Chitinophagaceae bacterium]|nr:TrmH family RNA methyltransferase [Chitinophagaceae bacterium]